MYISPSHVVTVILAKWAIPCWGILIWEITKEESRKSNKLERQWTLAVVSSQRSIPPLGRFGWFLRLKQSLPYLLLWSQLCARGWTGPPTALHASGGVVSEPSLSRHTFRDTWIHQCQYHSAHEFWGRRQVSIDSIRFNSIR